MQRPLNVVAIAMASFAEGYQENSQIMKVATSLFNSGKYIMNPDLRAQQVRFLINYSFVKDTCILKTVTRRDQV